MYWIHSIGFKDLMNSLEMYNLFFLFLRIVILEFIYRHEN